MSELLDVGVGVYVERYALPGQRDEIVVASEDLRGALVAS